MENQSDLKTEKKTVTVYFDYLSPFSYFFFHRYFSMENEYNTLANWNFKPILLGKVLNHWGQKGPAEIPPKRLYLFRQCLRMSIKSKIEFQPPQMHPFNPLYALRLSTEQTSKNFSDSLLQKKIIKILWEHIWAKGQPSDDPDLLEKLMEKNGLDGKALMIQSFTRESKLEVNQSTEVAIKSGVFGVPSFLINDPKRLNESDELLWGIDSWDDLIDILKNRDVLPQNRYLEILKNSVKGQSQQLSF